MEINYKYVILGVVVLILIGGFIYITKPGIFYSGSETASCNKVIYTGEPKEKINVVFMTDVLSDAELKEYANSLLSISPFSENKDKFNFFYLKYTPQCELQNGGLMCYSFSLIKDSASCPNDFIVAIVNSSNARSSAYMNVISLNKNLPKTVLAHEFAHVFANLADEYVPAVIPRGSKNCQASCDKFADPTSCYSGCGNNEYNRAIFESLMRTLRVNELGKLNQEIITTEINKY